MDVWTFDNAVQWLLQPSTWVAVIGPGLLSAVLIQRHKMTLEEWLLVLSCVVCAAALSRFEEKDGYMSLLIPSVLLNVILVLACLRQYLPSPGKAFAMCWLATLAVDASVVLLHRDQLPELRFPVGIGGAGLGDALFVEPLAAMLGLTLLSIARQRAQQRAAS